MLYLSKSRKQKLDNVIVISKKPKLEKEEETEESSEEEEAMSTVFLNILNCYQTFFKIGSCKAMFLRSKKVCLFRPLCHLSTHSF